VRMGVTVAAAAVAQKSKGTTSDDMAAADAAPAAPSLQLPLKIQLNLSTLGLFLECDDEWWCTVLLFEFGVDPPLQPLRMMVLRCVCRR